MLADGGISAKHIAQEVEGGSLDFSSDRRMREPLAGGEPFCFPSVGKQAVMPDFHEAGRQDMHEEAPDKLESVDSHGFPSVVVFVIAPPEGDLIALDIKDAVVRNGDTMGITAEVLNDGGGRFERRLAINDPFFVVAEIKQVEEMLWVVQIALLTEELKLLRT